MCPRAGRYATGIFAATVLLLIPTSTRGDDVTYWIDPLGSYLEITAMTGADIEVQFPGSDALSFRGVLDVRYSQDSIQLLDTTILEAVSQARVMPRRSGSSGAEPASAGFVAEIAVALDSSLQLRSQGPIALRHVRATMHSHALPIDGDCFPANGITIELEKAEADYQLTGDLDLIGSHDLTGLASENDVEESGCFLRLGNYEYLSIPIAVTWEITMEELVVLIVAEGEIAAYRELTD
jgi:hypothetical protein